MLTKFFWDSQLSDVNVSIPNIWTFAAFEQALLCNILIFMGTLFNAVSYTIFLPYILPPPLAAFSIALLLCISFPSFPTWM